MVLTPLDCITATTNSVNTPAAVAPTDVTAEPPIAMLWQIENVLPAATLPTLACHEAAKDPAIGPAAPNPMAPRTTGVASPNPTAPATKGRTRMRVG
mmetsp:Transcript_17311/g.34906  ORF Transcript_17311/g.34906 Transcript_17311/m.34906 type:complete len:97 (-) Transcript_17311:139-429(-)